MFLFPLVLPKNQAT
ncbi:predicted protein [Fibroporia radiculosa]|uniref:Uncharacterized protein n=1 Tax=Fibroporia radiculosa TaxID=599839 RepID=J7S6L9_9APHY|nr:predicted protein [Fibroporia radiculosa]